MTKAAGDPEQKKVMHVYISFGAGLFFSLLPFPPAAAVSLVLIFGVLLAAYLVRGGTQEGSLIENHMTYIIRTIWIGSLYAAVTMSVGSAYMLMHVDNTPLDPCIQKFLTIGPETQIREIQSMYGVFGACMESYIRENKAVFAVSAVISMGPIIAYFLVRYVHGLRRAMGGHRVANPKSWL